MKYFYAPAKYQMALPQGVVGVNGGVIYPSGIAAPTLVRRKFSKDPHLRNRYLDPQIYLASISAITSRKACSKLATYPWFAVSDIPIFESEKGKQNEFMKLIQADIHRKWPAKVTKDLEEIKHLCRVCIATQINMNCAGIILPAPMVIDQGDNYAEILRWLDVGLNEYKLANTRKPVLATVALCDSAIRSFDPWGNQLLDVIVDQLTSRSFNGAYIAIEQATESGYYCSHPNSVGAILRLVWGLKRGGLDKIMIGQLSVLGLMCLSVGAESWCSGWYRGERRLKLADLEDQTGRATPSFYSHKLATEIHLEADMESLVGKGYIDDIEDQSPASAGLLEALRQGKGVDSVPEWKYRQSNVNAAKSHFMQAAIRETAILSKMSEKEAIVHTELWLERAEELATNIQPLLGAGGKTPLNHQASWLFAFREFRKFAKI